jgi:hypothetical protein
MTVAAFIEWLKTQDQSAQVLVMRAQHARGWESGMNVSEVPFDPTPITGTFTVTDYSEPWAVNTGRTGVTLFLGDT